MCYYKKMHKVIGGLAFLPRLNNSSKRIRGNCWEQINIYKNYISHYWRLLCNTWSSRTHGKNNYFSKNLITTSGYNHYNNFWWTNHAHSPGGVGAKWVQGPADRRRRAIQGPHGADTTALKRSCAGDNFDELASDDGLSGPVEGDGQLVNHLTCINGQLTRVTLSGVEYMKVYLI